MLARYICAENLQSRSRASDWVKIVKQKSSARLYFYCVLFMHNRSYAFRSCACYAVDGETVTYLFGF